MLLGNTNYNDLFNIAAMPNYFADPLGNVGPVTLDDTKPKESKIFTVVAVGIGAFLVYKWVK